MDLMLLGYENVVTILLFIVGMIIVLWAQNRVTGTYKRMKKVETTKGITGVEVARKILDANGLEKVHVVEVQGQLTDHYDPSRKVVRLSKEIFHGSSIASIAVAAHEVGHAIQDKENYTFMRIRSFMAPIVNFVTYAGYFVALISLVAGITGYIKVGIFMVLASLLFQLVTLPVEFNASSRAEKQLKKLNLSSPSEDRKVKQMLDAAAMTYVASVISSMFNLLRLVIMLRNND